MSNPTSGALSPRTLRGPNQRQRKQYRMEVRRDRMRRRQQEHAERLEERHSPLSKLGRMLAYFRHALQRNPAA